MQHGVQVNFEQAFYGLARREANNALAIKLLVVNALRCKGRTATATQLHKNRGTLGFGHFSCHGTNIRRVEMEDCHDVEGMQKHFFHS
jgi:hypothetical protein